MAKTQFENDGERLEWMGVQGEKWTELFLEATGLGETMKLQPDFACHVQTWFANAIEAGRSVGERMTFHEEFSRENSVNEIAQEVYENAATHGWWENGRQFDGVLALIHSEASEALEEWRNGRREDERYYTIPSYRPAIEALPAEYRTAAKSMEEHHKGSDPVNVNELDDPTQQALVEAGFLKPEGIPAELADIVIRVMDCAVRYGIDLGAEIELKHAYNKTRPFRHGGKRS